MRDWSTIIISVFGALVAGALIFIALGFIKTSFKGTPEVETEDKFRKDMEQNAKMQSTRELQKDHMRAQKERIRDAQRLRH